MGLLPLQHPHPSSVRNMDHDHGTGLLEAEVVPSVSKPLDVSPEVDSLDLRSLKINFPFTHP